jgi:hypothetical protein
MHAHRTWNLLKDSVVERMRDPWVGVAPGEGEVIFRRPTRPIDVSFVMFQTVDMAHNSLVEPA